MTPRSLARRQLLLAASTGSLSLLASPGAAAAAAEPTYPQALHALGGAPQPSAGIVLDVPLLTQDGALVPVSVTSHLPNTREMLIVVDVNPQPLALRLSIPAGTEPYVATRIRMLQSGTVYAAVRTDAGVFVTARSAQVIAGGCG